MLLMSYKLYRLTLLLIDSCKLKISCSIILLLGFFFFTQSAFAAASLENVSCGSVSSVANWPRNVFQMTCTMDVISGGQTNLKLGVYSVDSTTSKISGNGANLTVTTPENRFKITGGVLTDADITTSGLDTLIYPDIDVDTSGISVTVKYTSFEADLGDTVYNHDFRFALYKSNNTITQESTQNLGFTIANKAYISVSSAPSITLNGSSQVFSDNQYYNSNTLSVSVKSNNTWKLQSKLTGNPTGGTKNIPVSSNYFLCTTSALFDCIASSRNAFSLADTYYDVAQNSTGEYYTGSDDSISLKNKTVEVTYSLKTTSAFDAENYITTTFFRLQTPKP